MLSELSAIIAPILICSSIGFIWVRTGTPYPSDFITRLVMNIGAPCLIVSSLGKIDVDRQVLGQVALAATFILASLGFASVIITRYYRLRAAVFIPPMLFANTGNMGLPLCFFAFGDVGLAIGLGVFLISTVAQMTVGMFIVSSGQGTITERLVHLLKQPLLASALIATAMLLTDSQLPLWLDNTVGLLAGFTIPLMMITLGVSLANLKVIGWRRSVSFSLLRLLGGFSIAWLCCEILQIEGIARSALILQSSMPVAVFNYLLAHKYHCDPQEVAGMVVISTLLSFISLPFLLSYLLM